MNEHRVFPTLDGRFAVVRCQGETQETLAELHSEDAALTWAAALNSGPVRSVGAGRWVDPTERSAA